MKDKIDTIRKEIKQLEPFINEQLYQLLSNGHTIKRAKELILNEIKQNVKTITKKGETR